MQDESCHFRPTSVLKWQTSSGRHHDKACLLPAHGHCVGSANGKNLTAPFIPFLCGRAQRAGLRVEDIVLCQPDSCKVAFLLVLSQAFIGYLHFLRVSCGRTQRAGLRVEDIVLCQPDSCNMAFLLVLSQGFIGYLQFLKISCGRAQRAGLRVEDIVLCQPDSCKMAFLLVLSQGFIGYLQFLRVSCGRAQRAGLRVEDIVLCQPDSCNMAFLLVLSQGFIGYLQFLRVSCGRAQRAGLRVEDIVLCQPDSGEMALEVVDQLVRSNAIDLIAVDSVAALVPRAEIEGEIGAVQGAAATCRCQRLSMCTLCSLLSLERYFICLCWPTGILPVSFLPALQHHA